MPKLKLDPATRSRHGISAELLGLVHRDGRFRCAGCHSSVDDLLRRLADESEHVAVASSDEWRGEVGPCAECGESP